MAVAVCLWWLYFDVVSLAAEHRLLEARGQARVDLAVEAYTYGNFPLVTIGVLFAAPPAAVVLPPLAGLAGLVVILAALIVVETTRYAQARRSLRGT
jgi:low temperature requirement protein LtrA